MDRAVPEVSVDALGAATPPAARAAYGPQRWLLEDLWSLDLPRVRFALPELTWMLDLPLWPRDGVRFQVSPREVLGSPNAFRTTPAGSTRRPQPAHPRDAPRRRWTVLDGSHRLASAVRRQDTAIDAWLVSEADLAAIAR